MRFIVLALLVAVASPADADTSVVAGPPKAARAELLSYMTTEVLGDTECEYSRITCFATGTKLCIAEDASLYASPDGKPTRKVRFGRNVEIAGPPRPLVNHEGRINRWYPVRLAGGREVEWLFGGVLTPFCIRGDLDGDGVANDLAAVYFEADRQVHVRARVGGKIFASAIAPGEPKDWDQGGRIGDVALLPATVAGLPLIKIATDHANCCANLVSYVSFTAGQMHHALLVLDYVATSDRRASVDVKFDAGSKTAVAREECWYKDEHGRVHGKRSTETRYQLVGRKYQAMGASPACFDEE
jgi:hypothetical protein